jgi:hypothetical protein
MRRRDNRTPGLADLREDVAAETSWHRDLVGVVGRVVLV